MRLKVPREPSVDADRQQREHYDLISAQYEAHNDDPGSQAFRRQFMYAPMFDAVKLSGARVLDAMCGNGQTTRFLLPAGASVIGLDVSEKQISSYKRRWDGCGAVCASIFDTPFDNESFDCVVILGGLHHTHPRISDAVREIERILKPGGHFCFAEPHTGSLPDLIRRTWYRHDRYFAENEASIDVEVLKGVFSHSFRFTRERYSGNVGYLLVLQSLILRLPLWLKRVYAPAALLIERCITPILGRRSACFVVCQWQKTSTRSS